MRRQLLKSKIHRATIMSIDLHYEGSLTLDAQNWMVRPRLRAES
jgi:aspartate 1-decarboxylase